MFGPTTVCAANIMSVSHQSDAFELSINSLRPSEPTGHNGPVSTLIQAMAWCLTAPSHCLNQCCWSYMISCGINLYVYCMKYSKHQYVWISQKKLVLGIGLKNKIDSRFTLSIN